MVAKPFFSSGLTSNPLDKILVATDGTESANEAVDLAVEMARRFDAALVALCVLPPRPGYDVEVEGLDLPYREGLNYAREVASEYNTPFQKIEKSGDPAEEIVETAEDVEAEMVVLGGTGKKGLSRLMLGSVAEKVVKESPVSVTVAK